VKTKKTLLIGAAAAVVVLLCAVTVYPVVAASAQTTFYGSTAYSASGSQLAHRIRGLGPMAPLGLSSGTTLTLTSISGGFKLVGDPALNGTAAGSLVLQVTAVFHGGYALSVSGGSLTVNGSTYAVTGGSAELGHYERVMVGQASAGGGDAFLFMARGLGDIGGTYYAIVHLDLRSGSNEYAVVLLATVSDG
jgi:hypothetical protein